MRMLRLIMCAIALAWAGPAVAGDPFDDARYYIGTRNNEAALQLIDSGQFDINMQTEEGHTLLQYAAGEGNLAMVNALLDRGADPHIKNSLGQTAYDRAIGTMVMARLKTAMAGTSAPAARSRSTAAGDGDFDKVRYAIGARRDADAIAELDKGIDINMQNAEGYTLLQFAAGDGNLAMVRELIRRGADVNIKNSLGRTALDRAIGTMVAAELKKAGGKYGKEPPAKPVPMTPNSTTGKTDTTSSAAKSKYADMCASRHYSSSALCSDSTCKMREYRKWQTCLKTGSYY